MLTARALLKSIRVSPQKTRQVVSLMKGQTALNAESQLRFHPSKGAKLLLTVLKSAMANAELKHLRPENLKVVSVCIDEGPRLKRSKGRSKGGRVPIIKRTSHLTVVVGDSQ